MLFPLRNWTGFLLTLLCLPTLTLGADSLKIRILGSGFAEPMEMSIADDGRIFVAERPGKVKLIDPAKPTGPVTLIDLKSDVRGESGLIGIALDPNLL